MRTFFAAAGLAAALAAGSAHAGGHVNWSIGINLPPVGAVISSGPQYPQYRYDDDAPVYSSGYGPRYGAVLVPAPVYAPPPVVVYRPAPPVFHPRYAPLPIAYGPPAIRWHDARGWRDDRWNGRRDDRRADRGYGPRGGDHRDDRWAPVPRDERRQRH